MKNTYKNFLKLANLFPDQLAEIDDAVMEYQETNDPMIANVCIAFTFCKMFPFMLWKVQSFFYLSDEDKSSFCVEELTKAIRDYDPRKKVTMYTLFDRYLSNRLRTETESLSYDKRKANNNAESYAITFTPDKEYALDSNYDEIEFLESLRSLNLNPNELRYCELIVRNSNKIKDADIASMLGISSAAINYIKDNLVKKITFLAM